MNSGANYYYFQTNTELTLQNCESDVFLLLNLWV